MAPSEWGSSRACVKRCELHVHTLHPSSILSSKQMFHAYMGTVRDAAQHGRLPPCMSLRWHYLVVRAAIRTGPVKQIRVCINIG